MSISEAGGISDEMSVEFTPGPVHPPAMTIVELRVIVTMPTSVWLAAGYSEEEIRLRHAGFRHRHDNEAETVAFVTAFDHHRRFVAERTADRLARFWQVVDRHADDKLIASFDVERHARHYADALEKNPTLVDEA